MRHQIFLPPPSDLLTPLGKDRDTAPTDLTFHTLSPPAEHSQGLSLPRRLDLAGKTWTNFSQAGLESLERSTVFKRPLLDSLHDEADRMPQLMADQTTIDEITIDDLSVVANTTGTPEDEAPRRKSRRLTRQSASFLSALPQYEPTPAGSTQAPGESFDSLDTTTNSFPSQPATNPGNRSVSNFPKWSIPLHRLATLQTLLSTTYTHGKLHTVIGCVISTEPVLQRQRKAEKAKGEEGSLWIGKWTITAPPAKGEGEAVCTVRLWDSLARDWGERVRRGDVVLLENVELRPSTAKDPTHLSISPQSSSRITILYRTIPRYATTNDYVYCAPPRAHGQGAEGMVREDKALRPDLRVGRSDVGVKRVEGVVRWFADWVGGVRPG